MPMPLREDTSGVGAPDIERAYTGGHLSNRMKHVKLYDLLAFSFQRPISQLTTGGDLHISPTDAFFSKMEDPNMPCGHLSHIRSVAAGTLGCEECLEAGQKWVHLRVCRECGHVGCCDNSVGKHATGHFKETGHPIIEGFDPPEGWGYCYVDDEYVDLPDQTPHTGPIPHYV